MGTFGASGTWTVDGLELRLAVPWHDDGRNGFYQWTHEADADPPTRLRGRSEDARSVQDFEVDLGPDRLRLTQKDALPPASDRSQPNYSWDVDCKRESRDPGTIPPTVPPSDGRADEPAPAPPESKPVDSAPTEPSP